MFEETSPLERRVLRREWTRQKSGLRRWNSLPCLQLVRGDRPLFCCLQCGFTNIYIPLCLWCCWQSESATREFQRSIPRARRMSAPSKTSSAGSTTNRPSQEVEEGDIRQLSVAVAVAQSPDMPQTGSSEMAPAHFDEARYQVESVSPAKRQRSSDLSIVDELPMAEKCSQSVALRSRRRMPGIVIHVPNHQSSMTTAPTKPSPSPSFPATSSRTLRRMQKRIFTKKTSSQSLQASVSHSRLRQDENRWGRDCGDKDPDVQTPHSPTMVRLGHPGRPYYTAIRKDVRPRDSTYLMLPESTPPPKSPPISICNSSPISHGSDCESPTSPLADTFIRPELLSTNVGPAPGFSLSGEIELRMALAQRQVEQRPILPRPSNFIFHKTAALKELKNGIINKDSGMKLKGRVGRFGKGLKEAVLRK